MRVRFNCLGIQTSNTFIKNSLTHLGEILKLQQKKLIGLLPKSLMLACVLFLLLGLKGKHQEV